MDLNKLFVVNQVVMIKLIGLEKKNIKWQFLFIVIQLVVMIDNAL